MAGLFADPENLASTAGEVEALGSAIGAARASAAAPTAGVVAAARDEVSAAIAKLFGAYGGEYQALLTRAEAFHSEFARTLAAAGSAYTHAEAAGTALLSNELGSPMRALLGQTPVASTGSTGAGILASLATQTGSPSSVTALIMGGVGNPGPLAAYMQYVTNTYIKPLFPGATIIQQGVTTPEQFWPGTAVVNGNGSTGWNAATYTFDQSVAKGLISLQNAVNQQLSLNNNSVVLGYSESATIATEEIRALLALPTAQQPLANQLSFILLGDPNNPVGGLFERFTGFYAPLFDVSFNGATPQSPWDTSVYTLQYDGIANFPQYPLNLLADINAINGIAVHAQYQVLTPTQLANAIPLPTSGGNTDYYMILTQDLPLLYQVREIPYVGNVVADLLQPDLRVLVDMGYADYGPNGNYANVPTPGQLFEIPNPFTIVPDLARGAVQGVDAALVDLGLLPQSALPTTYPYVPTLNPHLNFYLGQPSVTAVSVLSGALGDVLRFIPPGTDLPFL